jgi:hypothetical protein
LAVAVPSLVTALQAVSGFGDESLPAAALAWLSGWAVVVEAEELAAPAIGTTSVCDPAKA